LGPLTFGRPAAEHVFLGRDIARDRNYSEEVASAIDEEVRALIDQAHIKARAILEEHRDELERVVAALLEKETLTREEFLAALKGEELPSPSSEPEPEPEAAPVEEPVGPGLRTAPARGFGGSGSGTPGQRALEKGKPPKPAIGLE